METRSLPSIISSREIPGVTGNVSSRNLSWNDDGQCLIVSRQAITVATPHLATDLPPPSIPLNSKVLGDKDGKDDDEDEDDMDVDGGEGSVNAWRSLARPGNGEVKWWIMGVVEKGKRREEQYGWNDIGDEVSAVITERERFLRAAVWSPSGLSRLGGCLLAVMSSSFQVSVYAPGDDTLNSGYEEIADLTLETKSLLPRGQVKNGRPTLQGMLQMRVTAMEWSPPIKLPRMIGVDGSLLALATRAGGIDLWSCGCQGASRVAQIQLPSPWGMHLSWSEWTIVDVWTCSAQLAVALIDGSVWTVPVTRAAANSTDGLVWDIRVGELRCVSTSDRRAVTALKWMTDELLVFTKSGSVHLCLPSTGSVKTVRLERVGNWAGCNALGVCMGLYLMTPTTLVVVLDSLTYHIIEDILTIPRLQHIDSLRASLSARDVFLDCARRRRRKFRTESDKELTASTGGLEALDLTGDIVTWTTEPLARHNLDNATQVDRLVDFVTVDLKLTDDDSAMPALSSLLSTPPPLLYQSPSRQLAPHLFRMIARGESEFAEVIYGILAKAPAALEISVPSQQDVKKALLTALWGNPRLDALRLRWVLARWGQNVFSSMQPEFATIAKTYRRTIDQVIASLFVQWSNQAGQGVDEQSIDSEFRRNLVAAADVAAANGSTQEDSASCPACGAAIQSIGGGQAACSNGHEWDRCSVTHFLITTPDYRVCTVCPAISILPRSIDSGAEEDGVGDALVQIALEAAIACTCCGGRWSRPL